MKRDLDLLRQIMRDVEELQQQFGTPRTEPLTCRDNRLKANAAPERRKDLATATTVAEARRMKTAFGEFAARMLLKRAGVSPAVASRTLADPRDPRQLPDRRCYALR